MALSAIVIVMSVSFATLGSTVLTADRQATIDVKDDSNGVLALEPNTTTGVVTDDGNGELQINVPNGVNIDSTLELGDADFAGGTSVTDGAYTVTNNFGEAANVAVGYTVANEGSLTTGDSLKMVVKDNTGTVETVTVDDTSGSDQVTFQGLSDGGTLEVAIQVNTGTDSNADFTGTIDHEAQINTNTGA